MVQLLLTTQSTLGQETRWAYSRTLPSPHGAPVSGADLGFYKGGCPIHLKGAPLSAPLPNCFDQCYRNQTIRTTSRAMSNPLLSSYSSCFVFTKHPVQLKTVTTCFQSIFFLKKAPKQKGGCLDTLDTPSPGSATEAPRHVYFELVSRHSQSSQIQFEACA